METLARHMQGYHGAKGVDQSLFRVCHLPLYHGANGGYVEHGHDRVDMLVVKLHAPRDELDVGSIEWLVLV